MFRTRFLPFFLLLIIVIGSCGKISQIQVGEVNTFNIRGFEGNALVVELMVPVKNPSGHNISITGIDAKLSINNNFLGIINSMDTIKIPRKSAAVYNLVLYVRLANPLGAALTVMNLHKGQNINVKIDGDLTVKSGLISKKIEIREERNVVL